MMGFRAPESWQTAEIPGPKKALVITKPEVVTALIKRAKRPIMLVGHRAVEVKLKNGLLIDYLIRIAELGGIPVVATAHIQGEFQKRGFKVESWMPLMDIANRLSDPDWMGLDGKGQYDLLLIAGYQYYLAWLVLSGLKHFSQNLKTVSIDMYYQPHASWSFPNLKVEDWEVNLNRIIEGLGGE